MFHNNGTKSVKEIKSKFKNVPNMSIRGNTFDVRHLDRFIQSGAGNPQAYTKPTSGRQIMSGPASTISKNVDFTGNAIQGSTLSTINANGGVGDQI